MKKENIFKYISILFNLFVFVSGITIVIWILVYGYGTPLKYGSLHYEFLEYFTTLSNVYAAIVAGIVLLYLLINVKKDIVLPRWLSVLHLTSTTSLTLTMLTVLCFLGPTQGFTIMYKQDMFLYHLFNPLLVLASYLMLKHPEYSFKVSFFGIIPMAIYGVFYSSFVLSGVWQDFYGFTFGGQPWAIFVVLPIMLCVTYLISFLINLSTYRRQK